MVTTKTTRKSQNKTERQLNLRRTEPYNLVYSDGVRIAVSGYDFKLTFSVTEVLANNDVLLTEHTTIILSPQHARDFFDKLKEQVEQFEKDVMELGFKEPYQKRREDTRKQLQKQGLITD